MALAAATILFVIFVSNVVYGATTGTILMGDVTEMLVLFAASVFFVAAILRREARDKTDSEN